MIVVDFYFVSWLIIQHSFYHHYNYAYTINIQENEMLVLNQKHCGINIWTLL